MSNAVMMDDMLNTMAILMDNRDNRSMDEIRFFSL